MTGVLGLVIGLRAEVPSVTVKPVDPPPVIDGVLSEPMWQRPPDAKEFKLLNTGEPAREQTEVWLARNNAWLFIAFKCHDTKAASINCQVVSRDQAVSRDDSVEVFISPGTAGKSYWHFMINAAGVQGDNRAEGGDSGVAWDGHWRSGSKLDGKNGCWTAELAIPLFYLTEKAGIGEWTINMARHRKQALEELSTWSPVKDTFHSPEQFGKLEEMAGVKGAKLFAPVMTSVKVSPMMDIPRRYYEVKLGVMNQGGVPGEVQAYAVDITKDGETQSAVEKQTIGPGNKAVMTLAVDVAKLAIRKTRAVLTLTDALGVWTASTEVDRRKESKPLSVAMDRSYYTDEKTGNLVYQLNLPPGALKDACIRVNLASGSVYRAVVRGSAGRVPVPLSGLKPGVYEVQASLKDAQDELMAQETCSLIKREPAKAGNEVKTDRWNDCVLVNGKPFFPLGFFGVSSGNFSMLTNMGFNTTLRWQRMTLPQAIEYAAEAQKHGLYVLDPPDGSIVKQGLGYWDIGWLAEIRTGIRDKLPELVNAVKSNPSLLAWYGVDEPGGDDCKIGCIEMTEAINVLDGYHPNMQLFNGPPPDDDAWLGYWDIGSSDIYTFDMMDYLRAVKQSVAPPRYVQKPFWVVPLGQICTGSPTIFPPDKQRLQTYLSLIHGASGILYFAWPVTHMDTYAMFKALAAEIQALAPVLLTRSPAQTVKVSTEGEPEQVQVLLKNHPDGGYLMLAANVLDQPVSAEFRVPSLASGLRVARLFPDQPVALKDGAFTDRLEGMGTRAYRLMPAGTMKSELADDAPVIISLTLKPESGVAPGAKTAEQGMGSNLVTNPGFEQPLSVGWNNASKSLALDPSGAHGGANALRFERAVASAGLVAIGNPIELKPNAAYRFGGWVRGEFSSAKYGLILGVSSATNPKLGAQIQTQRDAEQARTWTGVERGFTNGPQPDKVQFHIYAEKDAFIGTAWADDLFLQEVVSAPAEVSRNILPNSGFEYASLPKAPDRWLSESWLPITMETLIGKEKALFTQDDKEVFEGKYSLRLRGMHQLHTAPHRHPFKLNPDKTYVFSVYMKADRPDVVVWMMIDGGTNQWKQAKVGTTWARYFCVGKGPAKTSPFSGISLRTEGAAGAPLSKEGWLMTGRTGLTEEKAATVWFDAAQLEEGTEPTAYVRDTYSVGGKP